jgi:DNA-binding SARP family transcriptional activator
LGRAALADAHGATVPLSAKAVALLTYLRLSPNCRAHRSFLADLLWSEVDDDRGRASLRQAVLAIRQLCGAELLVTDGSYLRVSERVSCDAITFLAQATRSEYVAAVETYSGDFFESFAVPGAHGFELWASVERGRLRSTFARSVDTVCQQQLDQGRPRDALDLATRLVQSDELRERSWRLLLECRLALGDTAAAAVDIATLHAVFTANDVDLDPATRALIARIQRGTTASSVASMPAVLRGDLVGRVAAFAKLLDAWKRVATQGRVVRTVTGDAGIGKTRLLDDLVVRLRSLGARVIVVRAQAGEHEIPFAFVASLAEALTALPGAAGVSPESAQTLVALEPRLRSVYKSAEIAPSIAEDVPLRRSAALADLIGAVSDDRAVALMVDDAHWADPASVRTLAAASSRLTGARLLLLIAQRHAVTAAFECEDIALDVLHERDVHELLDSISPLPDTPWVTILTTELLRASRGVPLLVIEALQLLTQERLLIQHADGWLVADATKLSDRLATLDVLHGRLLQVDDAMRAIVLRVALASGPLRTSILADAIGDPNFDASLARLVAGGWVVSRDNFTTVSHDEIARSVLATAEASETEIAATALTAALRLSSHKSDAEWRLEARLALGAQDFAALALTITQWIASDVVNRGRGGWRGALSALLGDQATDDVWRRVRSRRPFRERVARMSRRIVAAALLFIAVGAIGGFAYHRAVTPVALRFVVRPLAASDVTMGPDPVIEILNAAGQRIATASNTIDLRLQLNGLRLVGRSRLEARDGVATFSGLRVIDTRLDSTTIVLEASSAGLLSARTTLIKRDGMSLRVQRVSSLGTAKVRINADTVIASAGSRVELGVEFIYTSPWLAASVMLAGVRTWGDVETSWLELGPMVTPARASARYSVVAFTAPRAQGHYRVFFVMAAEGNAADIASGTNWEVGEPRWRDGNDLANWGDAEASAAKRTGGVTLGAGKWLYAPGHSPDLGGRIAAGVIEVIVSAPVAMMNSPVVSGAQRLLAR